MFTRWWKKFQKLMRKFENVFDRQRRLTWVWQKEKWILIMRKSKQQSTE